MVKRVVAVLLSAVLLLGTTTFALAGNERGHDGETRTPATCPTCGMLLNYRYYTATRAGSGNICYIVETYEQPYCSQHGNVYGAQLATSHEYYHDWGTDYTSGRPKCRTCGEYGSSRLAGVSCDAAPTGHRWMTNYASGRAECSLCDLISVGELSAEELICPNHKTFHDWMTDAQTGEPVCSACE